MTTIENDNYGGLNGDGRILTEPETRMTVNFNRETLAFDNNKCELDENFLR